PPSQELFLHYLRTHKTELIQSGTGGGDEERLENYVVRALMDFDDVAYEKHADLLYDLARQVVAHLGSYLEVSDVAPTLRFHEREIARFLHAQMEPHYWEEAAGYDVQVSRGFVPIQGSAFTMPADGSALDLRTPPTDKAAIARYVFSGLERCLQA